MRSLVSVPDYHVKPLVRLQKPMDIECPDNYPNGKLKPRRFYTVLPTKRSLRLHELIYDPLFRSKRTQMCFSGDFECGNLGQVFQTGARQFEIHLLPDPSSAYSALWYFFKVEDIPPGDYQFTIVGFFRDCHLHGMGVQPVALSMNDVKRGIGWRRHGNKMNFWCWKKAPSPQYALSFTFTVTESDTMYFAYLYPYTYTDLRNWLSNHKNQMIVSVIARSHGGVDVPAIFWDADAQAFIHTGQIREKYRAIFREPKKPLLVIAARHHPGESNASFAMEGFMETLIGDSSYAKRLLKNFSVLMLPMMNVDGVICGYYRPTLVGYDMNRSWVYPDRIRNPVEHAVIALLDKLTRSRPLVFLLDYHGHTAQCNAFTYGVWNDSVVLNEYEGLFPRLMSHHVSVFDESGGNSMTPETYTRTMRVALHQRYQIPFAYTLEMSFGGIDIGSLSQSQFTPETYREVGRGTVPAIAQMLLDHVPLSVLMKSYSPPVRASAANHTFVLNYP